MAEPVSLNDLIEALAGAVIFAQDRIEKHQLSKISQYFDETNRRPISVNIKLPDISLDAAEDDEIDISIPLLALVGSSTLHIKGMDVEFEVDLSSFCETDESSPDKSSSSEGEETLGWQGTKRSKSIGVDWQSAGDKKMARLSLRVEAQEPTEGMARLIQRLNKLI
jgi:hypothetical protein